MLARIRSVLVISDAPAFSFGEAKENAEWQLQICTTYQPFSSFSKTPQGQKRYSRPQVWDESMLASWCHPNSGNFQNSPSFAQVPGCADRRFRRVRALYARSADVLPGFAAKAFQQSGFLSAQARVRYCFRVIAGHRIDFLFFIIIRQSRSPRCSPRISISAEARLVAQGTLYVSHRRSVRMMR